MTEKSFFRFLRATFFVLFAVFVAVAFVAKRTPAGVLAEVGRGLSFLVASLLQTWLFVITYRTMKIEKDKLRSDVDQRDVQINTLANRLGTIDLVASERTRLLQDRFGVWTVVEGEPPETDVCIACGEEVFFRACRSSWHGRKLLAVAHLAKCGRWCIAGEVPPGEPAHASFLGCGCRSVFKLPSSSRTFEQENVG